MKEKNLHSKSVLSQNRPWASSALVCQLERPVRAGRILGFMAEMTFCGCSANGTRKDVNSDVVSNMGSGRAVMK